MSVGRLLIGEKVRLTALERDDTDTIARWYHDSAFVRLYDGTVAAPRSRERWQKWYDDLVKEQNAVYFGLRRIGDAALIGLVDLDGILWNQGVGWVGIAIGDQTHRGHGYGYEAMELLLRFAFDECNLHRVQLTVFSYNIPAIKLYEKLGFMKEGVYREFLLRDGSRHDMILYGLLRREWEEKVK